MYLVFEGPDGAGKTTAMKRLAKELKQLNCNIDSITCHRQPGDTNFGKRLRKILKTNDLFITQTAQMFTVLADHAQFSHEKLGEYAHFLHHGDILVLQDRHSAVSGYAYQVVGNQAPYGLYTYAYNLLTPAYLKPDLVLLFQPSYKTIIKRIKRRGEMRDRYEGNEFLKKVIKGYKQVVECGVLPKDSYTIINANGNEDLLYKRVLSAIIKHPKFEGTEVAQACRELRHNLK